MTYKDTSGGSLEAIKFRTSAGGDQIRLTRNGGQNSLELLDNGGNSVNLNSKNPGFYLNNFAIGRSSADANNTLSVNGNISASGAINTLSHITSSGNISASGDIIGNSITSSTAQIGNLTIQTGFPGGNTMFGTTNNVGFTFNNDIVSQPEGKNLGTSARAWNNLYQGANTSDYLVDVANGVRFDFVPSVVSYYLWDGSPTRDDTTAENKPPIYSINPGQEQPTSYRGYFGIIQPSGSVDTLSTNTANKFGLFAIGQGGRTILGRKDYNRTNDSIPVDKMFTIYDGQTSTRELFSIETGSGATRISGSTTITGNLTASATISASNSIIGNTGSFNRLEVNDSSLLLGSVIITGSLSVEGPTAITGSSIISSSNSTASLTLQSSGSTVFDIQGSQGQLFSVTDDLIHDVLLVNDISGNELFKVSGSGLVEVFEGSITTPQGTINSLTASHAMNVQPENNFMPVATHTTNFTSTSSYAGHYNIVGGNLSITVTTGSTPTDLTPGMEWNFFQTSSGVSFTFTEGTGVEIISRNNHKKLAAVGSAGTLKYISGQIFHLVGDLTI